MAKRAALRFPAVESPASRSELRSSAPLGRPPARFDGAAAWASIRNRADRDALGALLLELMVADAGVASADSDALESRAHRAAFNLLAPQLHALAGDILPTEFFAGAVPPVPSMVGDVCRFCRCTEFDACETPSGPCAWVKRGLCSACAIYSGRALECLEGGADG